MHRVQWIMMVILLGILCAASQERAYAPPGPCTQCNCASIWAYWRTKDTGQGHIEYFIISADGTTRTQASQAWSSIWTGSACLNGDPTETTTTLTLATGPSNTPNCTTNPEPQPCEVATGDPTLTTITESQYICYGF